MIIQVDGYDIEGTWFKAVQDVFTYGRTYTITRGSMEGHKRIQLDGLCVSILHPEQRPLAVTYSGKCISTDRQLEEYFRNYLYDSTPSPNEQYTYGQRIYKHLHTLAGILVETPNTNQACIEVGQPDDINLEHPPCLRCLSWKVIDETLQLSSFWRSWDIAEGFPVNMGGLQLLNELIAGMIGIPTGKLIAYSDGAHLYDYQLTAFPIKNLLSL